MTATIVSTLSADHSGTFVRPLIGLVTGLAVTAGLFWTMQFLIELNVQQLTEESKPALTKFVWIKNDEKIVHGRWKPESLPIPEPPPVRPPPFDMTDRISGTYLIEIPEVSVASQMTGGFSLGVNEGDYLPITKMAPIYPMRALSRGKQGHCVIVYTETRHGTIRDPVIIESQCSSSLFHQAPEGD